MSWLRKREVASTLWNALIESSERLRRAPRREDLAQQAHELKHSIVWPFKPPVFLSFEKKCVISSRFPDVTMELWEKQHTYIPRRFVWSKWSSADRFARGRGWSSSSSFDHPVLAGSSWPEVLPGVRGYGDGHHQEPPSALWNALIESSKRLRRAPRKGDLAQQAHGSKHSIVWPFNPPVFLSFEKKSVISSRFPDVAMQNKDMKAFMYVFIGCVTVRVLGKIPACIVKFPF
jgi:hypothetical protein